MAIQYRGTGTSNNSGGTGATSATVTLPTGWAAGDLLFVAFQTNNTIAQTFTMSGWTIDFSGLNGSNYAYMFAHRLMQAGDTNPSVGWSNSQVWAWSCGGFFSSIGLPLSFDSYAASDPLVSTTAGNSATPHAGSATLGPNTASMLLTIAGGNTQGTTSSHTYTPSSGWTWNDGDGAYQAFASRPTMFAANAYNLGSGGSPAPGSESLTDSGGSDKFFFTIAQALVHEPAQGGVLIAMPGRTWKRHFQHSQQSDLFPTAPDTSVFVNDADNGLFTETDPPGLAPQTIPQDAQPGLTWRRHYQHHQISLPTTPDVRDFANDADNGLGTESDPSTIGILPIAAGEDTGTGAEASTITAAISDTDTGTFADAGEQISLPRPMVPYALPGQTWLRYYKHHQVADLYPFYGIADSDSGHGTESDPSTIGITSPDAGTGIDGGEGLDIQAADTGTFADASSIAATLSDADAFSGDDEGYPLLPGQSPARAAQPGTTWLRYFHHPQHADVFPQPEIIDSDSFTGTELGWTPFPHDGDGTGCPVFATDTDSWSGIDTTIPASETIGVEDDDFTNAPAVLTDQAGDDLDDESGITILQEIAPQETAYISLSSSDADSRSSEAVTAITVTDSDVASAADTNPYAPGKHVVDSDAATCTDAGNFTNGASDLDIGHWAEASSITAAITDSDSGHGADGGESIVVPVTSTDSGSLSDQQGTLKVIAAETFTGAEAAHIALASTDSFSCDQATGENAGFPTQPHALDSGSFTEASTLTAVPADSDAGGVDPNSGEDYRISVPELESQVTEVFSVVGAWLLNGPDDAGVNGSILAQIPGVRGGSVSLEVNIHELTSDDVQVGAWAVPVHAAVTIEAGFYDAPVQVAMGQPFNQVAGQHGPIWGLPQLLQNMPLNYESALLIRCMARDAGHFGGSQGGPGAGQSAPTSRTFDLILYRCEVLVTVISDVQYKGGSDIQYSCTALFSNADEFGTALPASYPESIGRVVSMPGNQPPFTQTSFGAGT